MHLSKISLALFYTSLTIFSESSFAARPDMTIENQAPVRVTKAAAVVRFENDRPVCVRYSKGVQVDHSVSKLPNCSNHGQVGDETKSALSLATGETTNRTAFASHLGVAGVGCAIGSLTSMLGAAVQSSEGRSDLHPALGPAVAALGLGASLGLGILATDATGHALAFYGGYAACAGGVIYLIYTEHETNSNRSPLDRR